MVPYVALRMGGNVLSNVLQRRSAIGLKAENVILRMRCGMMVAQASLYHCV